MATKKKAANAGVGDRDPLEARLSALGMPLGGTLTALLALREPILRAGVPDLFTLVDASDAGTVQHCRDEYDVELVGRHHNGLGYFGFSRNAAAKTLDASPVVAVDDKGMDPEVVARNLADLLSLVAYSPTTWGDSAAEWKSAEQGSLDDFPDEVPRLRELLCALPGVTLPTEPWKLQERLPKVKLAPAADSPSAARLSDADFADEVDNVVDEAIGNWGLLLVSDGIESGNDGIVRLKMILDVPDALKQVLGAHPSVRERLLAVLAAVRAAFPERKFKVQLGIDCLSAVTGDDPWARLQVALKHAGREDLRGELFTHRR